MFERITQHPTLMGYRKQYEMLPAQDRLALKALVSAVALAVLYFAVCMPIYEFKKNAELNLEQNKQLLSLVLSNKKTLSSIAKNSSGAGTKKALNSQQLVSSVTNLAKRKGVVLKRFEPSGDNKLKVWVDDASFDKVMSWLTSLNQSLNVKVEQVSIEKDDAPGQISARLTLSS